MRVRHSRIVVFTVLMVLLIPVAASATDQTVDVTVLPEDTLSISVEEELYLGTIVPGQSTELYEFGMSIINTTASGWAVTVTGTDLESYNVECDEFENCSRVPTDPLYTIDASAFHVRGGDQDNWGEPGAIVAYEGNLADSVTPFTLMEGTSTAYGEFGLDDQRPAVSLDIPGAGVEYANYYGTLTYTITGT